LIFRRQIMGIIRESAFTIYKRTMIYPSVLFGFDDLPETADILLNDISEKILIKKFDESGKFCDVDILSYDEYEQLVASGLRGARAGRKLRNEL